MEPTARGLRAAMAPGRDAFEFYIVIATAILGQDSHFLVVLEKNTYRALRPSLLWG